MLAYHQKTATGNDLLNAGPSGGGCTYGSWSERALDAYTALTGRFLRRTGLDLVYACNPRNAAGAGRVPFDERVVRSCRDHTQARGIIQSWETGISGSGLPECRCSAISSAGTGGGVPGRAAQLIKTRDGGSPLVIAGAVNAWSWTPSDGTELGELVGGPVRDRPWRCLLRSAEPGRNPRKPGPLGGPAYAAS
ncbi:hypothetical protein ACIHCV_35465 [Streptomyces sp. NPDC051956]|uniref:hypothetical protein n=1 Tax=Streptomyces sp. NPDC051956 TaxID=3365677 RepID=UPI0037D666A4